MKRVRSGTPSGGQFAANNKSEDSTVRLSAPPLQPAAWGDDLDGSFSKRLASWGNMVHGKKQIPVLELLRIDEETADAVYGTERAAWLGRLQVRAVSTDPQGLSRQSVPLHPEEARQGRTMWAVLEDDLDDFQVAEYEGPADRMRFGGLTHMYRTADDPGDVFDVSDPMWNDEVFGPTGREEWRDAGFNDPRVAIEWARSGFYPDDARHRSQVLRWSPEEAARHRATGFIR